MKVVKRLFHFFFEYIFCRLLMPRTRKIDNLKILISGYTGLGHFILKSVLVKKIRKIFPDSEIIIIAGNSFGTEFVFDEFRTLILNHESSVFKKILFFLKLRKEKIDVILLSIDASPTFLIRGALLAGIPERIGHRFENEIVPDYYYTKHVIVSNDTLRSEIDINLKLLDSLTGEQVSREYKPFVHVDPDENLLKKYDLMKNRYICIQTGGANGMPTTKKWLEGNYKLLVEKLLTDFPDINITGIGDTGDSIIAERIFSGFDTGRVLDLTGKTTLNEVKTLIYYSRFVICHDSGIMHMANALSKKTLAIYGPSDPDYYTVNLPTFHLISNKVFCSPCQGMFPGKFNFITEEQATKQCPMPECMKSISVNMVYDKCVEILDKKLETTGVLDD